MSRTFYVISILYENENQSFPEEKKHKIYKHISLIGGGKPLLSRGHYFVYINIDIVYRCTNAILLFEYNHTSIRN